MGFDGCMEREISVTYGFLLTSNTLTCAVHSPTFVTVFMGITTKSRCKKPGTTCLEQTVISKISGNNHV